MPRQQNMLRGMPVLILIAEVRGLGHGCGRFDAVAGMTEFRFAVRAKPGARKDVVGGCWNGPNGPALIVAVAAPAVDGKANEALRAALADALGIRRQDVTVVTGLRGRDKVVAITGISGDLAGRVAHLRDG